MAVSGCEVVVCEKEFFEVNMPPIRPQRLAPRHLVCLVSIKLEHLRNQHQMVLIAILAAAAEEEEEDSAIPARAGCGHSC